MLRSLGWGIVALCTVITAVPSAEAQGASCEQARTLFEQATLATEELRWSDALSGFERAYEHCPVATALFNAGLALRALGRHREARDAFQRVVDEHADDPDATAEGIADARRKRDEEAARVAMLSLTGLEPGAAYEVRLDGREVETGDGSRRDIEADPGDHTLVTDRDGYEPFTWEGRLADGEQREIVVIMTEQAQQVPSGGGGVHWAVWVAIAAVLVGGGVLAYVLIDRAADLEPGTDNVLAVEF